MNETKNGGEINGNRQKEIKNEQAKNDKSSSERRNVMNKE